MMVARWIDAVLQPMPARWLTGALIIILIAFPWIAGEGGQYYTVLLMTVFIFAVLGHAWNLLAGFCGLLSFGTQVYVGLAGFTVAIFSYYFNTPVWWGMVFGGVVAGLFAWLLAVPISDRHAKRNTWIGVVVGVALWIAYEIVILYAPEADIFGGAYIRRVIILLLLFLGALPLLKLQGAYFAVATWLVAAAVASIFNEWRVVGAGGGMTIASDTTITQRYYAGLILVVAATFVVWWLLNSRYGLALTAVRDDDEAAASIGIDIKRVKTMVFVISAPMAGLAAGLYYIDTVTITPPDAFHITWSAYVVFIVVAGGMGTLAGPLIGAVLFVIVQRILVGYWGGGELTLGIAAVLLILILPRGIAGLISDVRAHARARPTTDTTNAAEPAAPKRQETAVDPVLWGQGLGKPRRPSPQPEGGVVAGALLPPLSAPSLAAAGPDATRLEDAGLNAMDRLLAARPDTIVLVSATWPSAIGVPLEGRAGMGPEGFAINRDLTDRIAASPEGKAAGAQVITEGAVPFDQGAAAITTLRPAQGVRWVVMGVNPALGGHAAARLGRAVDAAARASGTRVAVVAVGGLSHSAIGAISPEDDTWNRRMLGLLSAGKGAETVPLAENGGEGVRVDASFFHGAVLMGAVGERFEGADILAYGASGGTGAAVLTLRLAPPGGQR
ncbi:MAG: hypothetical protein ROR55_20650 [Devosia sp.]